MLVLQYFQYKLCKVKKVGVALKGVPYVTTHDGRTIRYPDPMIKVNDSLKVDIASGKIEEYIKFDTGLCLCHFTNLNLKHALIY